MTRGSLRQRPKTRKLSLLHSLAGPSPAAPAYPGGDRRHSTTTTSSMLSVAGHIGRAGRRQQETRELIATESACLPPDGDHRPVRPGAGVIGAASSLKDPSDRRYAHRSMVGSAGHLGNLGSINLVEDDEKVRNGDHRSYFGPPVCSAHDVPWRYSKCVRTSSYGSESTETPERGMEIIVGANNKWALVFPLTRRRRLGRESQSCTD